MPLERRLVDLMFERPIHLNKRGNFLLRYDDIEINVYNY